MILWESLFHPLPNDKSNSNPVPLAITVYGQDADIYKIFMVEEETKGSGILEGASFPHHMRPYVPGGPLPRTKHKNTSF